MLGLAMGRSAYSVLNEGVAGDTSPGKKNIKNNYRWHAPAVQFGGTLNNGTNAGPFYVNLDNRLGNARFNYGAFGLF